MATSEDELAPIVQQLVALGAATASGLVPPMLTVDVPESCSLDRGSRRADRRRIDDLRLHRRLPAAPLPHAPLTRSLPADLPPALRSRTPQLINHVRTYVRAL